jgi:hypothetical protein
MSYGLINSGNESHNNNDSQFAAMATTWVNRWYSSWRLATAELTSIPIIRLEAVVKTTALSIAVLHDGAQCSCTLMYTPLARRRARCAARARRGLKHALKTL